jgi:arsenate reductase (thioredoxin)
MDLNREKLEKKLKTRLFYLCVENAGRSQMAEAFFRKYAPRGYLAKSAGTRPAGEINPLAVEVMKEMTRTSSTIYNVFKSKRYAA